MGETTCEYPCSTLASSARASHWLRSRASRPRCARDTCVSNSCARAWRSVACAAIEISLAPCSRRPRPPAGWSPLRLLPACSSIPCCAKSNGAAGVGLLVLEIGLRLRQSGLRGLHLRFRAQRCAGGFAAGSGAPSPGPRAPSALACRSGLGGLGGRLPDPRSQWSRSARRPSRLCPSSTVSVWMRPGILELTITSLASTVPISCRSLVRRVVSKYQISDPTVSTPRYDENSISRVHLSFTSNYEIGL